MTLLITFYHYIFVVTSSQQLVPEFFGRFRFCPARGCESRRLRIAEWSLNSVNFGSWMTPPPPFLSQEDPLCIFVYSINQFYSSCSFTIITVLVCHVYLSAIHFLWELVWCGKQTHGPGNGGRRCEWVRILWKVNVYGELPAHTVESG